ncbi:MAG: hypothetical protein H6700_00810 [Myxococcales bacterium]|nr:hypothetical protein [Myxococcales bacterium]
MSIADEALDSAPALAYRELMPSTLHELLLEMVRRDPGLLRSLTGDALTDVWMPNAPVSVVDSQLVSSAPIERRADLVLELPGLSVVVEAQLRVDAKKLTAWPAYQALRRARSNHPVAVVVLTTKRSVERWATAGVELGPGQVWAPLVVGPSAFPTAPSRETVARNPELAVLAAELMDPHSPVDEGLPTLRTAVHGLDDAARAGLADDTAELYLDAVLAAAPEAVRRALEAEMELRNYEYKSDFAKKYYGQGVTDGRAEGEARGRAEGEARGRAEAVLAVAASRGLVLSTAERTLVAECRDLATLDRWVVRAATVERASEIFA